MIILASLWVQANRALVDELDFGQVGAKGGSERSVTRFNFPRLTLFVCTIRGGGGEKDLSD